MGKKITLGDIELRLHFDDLHIIVEQVSYGIFNHSIPSHRHGKTYYEAHYVSGGKGTLIAEGKECPLKKGVLYMTGPNVTHKQLTDKSELMEEYCLGFEIKKDKKNRSSEVSKILAETHFWIGESNGKIEKLFEQLSEESRCRLIGYQNVIKNIISSILVEIVRTYTNSAASMEKLPSPPDDKRTIFIDSTFLWHYNTVTLSGLASSLDLSQRQLQRFLLKQYGKTFSQLKHEARRNKAIELLNSGLSPEETTAAIGYSDLRSLYKLFE